MRRFVTAAGRRLEVELVAGPADRPPIVFLHEGLGSIALWRDFPVRLCERVGHPGVIYSRYGYGRSEALQGARPVDFMHREALESLPALLDALGVERPILLGHSDGGSIARIHAGARVRPVAALVVMAPHVMVEDLSIRSIEAARRAWAETDLRQRLARYHDDPDGAFRGWNDAWLDPAFRSWNIESYLPAIDVPVLALQGEDDEYGTLDQIERIARAAPRVELLALAKCGHSPHRDRPEAVIEAVERFLAKIARGPDAR